MIRIKLLICLSLFYGCENIYAAYRYCSSCMLLRQCPEALSLLNNRDDSATIAKLINSLCGAEVVDGETLPKVCCSDFDSSNIETHKNIALLPEDCGRFCRKLTLDETVNQYEFPLMALLYYKNNAFDKNDVTCEGGIINNRYILIAAHCAERIRNVIKHGVFIGGDNIISSVRCEKQYRGLPCKNNTQLVSIEKVLIHKNFRKTPKIDNNVALLRLQEPIDFSSDNVAPLCLPIYEGLRNMEIDGKFATVVGLEGNTFYKIEIPISNKNECRAYYNEVEEPNYDVIKNNFCAGGKVKDICKTIGGGPLMLKGEYNGIHRVIQYGIQSYGHLCGSGDPDVYTDVRKYVKWILDNIEE